MKTFLRATALLVLASPAFADHTRFVTPRATPALTAPARESSAYAPYSRSTPRFQSAPASTPAWHRDASRAGADRALPYSRSLPRFNRGNA